MQAGVRRSITFTYIAASRVNVTYNRFSSNLLNIENYVKQS